MKIEKGIIPSQQLMFLIIGLLQASTLTAALISGISRQNTWIVLIVGFFISLLLLLVYLSISSKFPGKSLIEINSQIYGRYLGKMISIIYIYYFWFIISTHIRFISDFFSTYLFSETDISVFIIAVMLVSMYAVRKGIEVIGRTGLVLSIFSLIIAVLITILNIKDIHLSNFLPVLQIGLKEIIQGVNAMVAIPFGEVIVFLMFFPYVNDKERIKKSAIRGFTIGSIYFLIIILRNTAVLGNIVSFYVLPSYQVAKLIDIGEIVTRVEALIAMALLFNVFLKICIYYYAAVLSTAQLFKLSNYRPLVMPIGIISIVMSMSMFNSPVDEAYVAANIYPVFAIPIIIILPIISLIIASVRKLQ